MGWGGGPAPHSLRREGRKWLWRLRNTAVGVRAGLAGRGGGEGTQVASGIKITSGTAGRGWAEEGGGEAPGVWTNKVVLRGIAGDVRWCRGAAARVGVHDAGGAERSRASSRCPKRSPTPIPILPLRDNSPFPSPFVRGIRRGVRAVKGSSGSRTPTAAAGTGPKGGCTPSSPSSSTAERAAPQLHFASGPGARPPLLAPLLPETTAAPQSNFSSAR